MRAIRVHAYGDPSAMRLERIPPPVPRPGEILVRVHAASVNPVDWKVCDGMLREQLAMELPFTPGGDFAGVVVECGAGVTAFSPGDPVFGMTSTPGYRSGAFAEFVAVRAADAAKKPASLDMGHAAAVPLAALTAWQALFDRAEIRENQKILIHAGAGGVGGFAIQFARHAGAHVIATASAANADFLRDLGAEQVIDYRATAFETVLNDLDAVIDLIGGETQARSYAVLRRGGVLVNAWGAIMRDKADAAGVRGVKVAVAANGAQLSEIAALIDAGAVRITLARCLPLARIAQAYALSRDGHVRGKIVLTVDAEPPAP
jgi:NADPH:quinone reductase-like Zn-dependent oxidoreductase